MADIRRDGPDLPVGTVVAIGHPGNARLAVRSEDCWHLLLPGSPTVPAEDWRAGWTLFGVPALDAPRPDFCRHPKGPNSATVPDCLRTLDDIGACPVHGTDTHTQEAPRAPA